MNLHRWLRPPVSGAPQRIRRLPLVTRPTIPPMKTSFDVLWKIAVLVFLGILAVDATILVRAKSKTIPVHIVGSAAPIEVEVTNSELSVDVSNSTLNVDIDDAVPVHVNIVDPDPLPVQIIR